MHCQNEDDPTVSGTTCHYKCPCFGTHCQIMFANAGSPPGTVTPLCEVYFAVKV